jgi:CHAD domain-containing protein
VTDQPGVPTTASEGGPADRGLLDDGARAEPTAAALIAAVLTQFATNFLLNAPVKSSDLEIPGHEPRRRESSVERVHQARVAVRRLRSTLRTYGGVIEPGWSGALATELSWYGDVLGVARDLDVLRGTIAGSLRLVDDEALRSLLMGLMDASISEAARRGVEQRATPRYARLVDVLTSIETGVHFVDGANGPAREVLGPLLDGAWRDAQSACRGALERRSNRRLHRLRIALKRLQYATETLGVVEGNAALRTARGAEALQTRLGAVHDADVALEWLRGLVAAEPNLGRPLRNLMEFHKTARRGSRRGWRGAMRRVERSWRRWHDE